MTALLWWSGITLDTKIRDIGWTWLLFVVAVIALVVATVQLIREW